MSEPYVGEIKIFAGNFAPRNWSFCDGQLLAISQFSALFSLLGTIYGGDGRTTFALPDLRGRLPVHQGQGIGLTNRRLGSQGGREQVTLNVTQLPVHSHGVAQAEDRANAANPAGALLAKSSTGDLQFLNYADTPRTMGDSTISATGGGQPHNNMPPYQCISFIIALLGFYPSPN